MNTAARLLPCALLVLALATGCGSGTGSSPSSQSGQTGDMASSVAAVAPQSPAPPTDAVISSEPQEPTTAATDEGAASTGSVDDQAVTGTAPAGYTCLYADVDGNVEVPCDADVCLQVGCLRSDGVYIGPAADEMNSANAPTPVESSSATLGEPPIPTP